MKIYKFQESLRCAYILGHWDSPPDWYILENPQIYQELECPVVLPVPEEALKCEQHEYTGIGCGLIGPGRPNGDSEEETHIIDASPYLNQKASVRRCKKCGLVWTHVRPLSDWETEYVPHPVIPLNAYSWNIKTQVEDFISNPPKRTRNEIMSLSGKDRVEFIENNHIPCIFREHSGNISFHNTGFTPKMPYVDHCYTTVRYGTIQAVVRSSAKEGSIIKLANEDFLVAINNTKLAGSQHSVFVAIPATSLIF